MKQFLPITLSFILLATTCSAQFTAGTPGNTVLTHNGDNVGIGTSTPTAPLSVIGPGSNGDGVLNVQSSTPNASGTLIRDGFYAYVSQDNSGSFYQSWGMRLNGTDNLWYRIYSATAKYLPYMQISTSGTIAFGGSASNATTDANPTLNAAMTIDAATGSVAIGTSGAQGYRLAVNGGVIGTSVTVKLFSDWPDYVFRPSYRLPPLGELEAYVKANRHLPDVPGAAEVEKNGLNLGEINKVLVKRVEELTLYVIEKDKQLQGQQQTLRQVQQQLTELAQQVKALQQASDKR